MSDLQWLSSYFADASRHFALSGFTGASVFCLTSITLSAIGLAWERGTRRKVSSAVGYGILITCLLAGLSAALLSHYALDYYSAWFVRPLGPPLQIDTGGIDF